MRGALCFLGECVVIAGIIPAYAGSTLIMKIARHGIRDHPRVCGEHLTAELDALADWGSSPRMRGAHRAIRRHEDIIGIIPAYAGSTACPRSNRGRGWDHPRVCGEHYIQLAKTRLAQGSSPRMRGARRRRVRVMFEQGIIPAYAGSTNKLVT